MYCMYACMYVCMYVRTYTLMYGGLPISDYLHPIKLLTAILLDVFYFVYVCTYGGGYILNKGVLDTI